jgi:hypothetical protein
VLAKAFWRKDRIGPNCQLNMRVSHRFCSPNCQPLSLSALQGFLPSIKSKKVRVRGTIPDRSPLGVPVNAVVGGFGVFSRAKVFG